MKSDKIKILYITGWGRSGSTILSMLLGQLDGFFLTGEMYQLWQSGFIDNELCGCGSAFSDCQTWRSIIQTAYSRFDNIDPHMVLDYLRHYVRTKSIPQIAFSRKTTYPQDFIDSLDSLYSAVNHVTGCRVIVDSSKHPVYGKVLESLPSVDVYVIHLVRDPRAVAYSWQRTKQVNIDSDKLFRKKNTSASSYKWLIWNLGIHILQRQTQGRYLRIRYEDLITQPQSTMSSILRFVGEEESTLSFQDGDKVEVASNHSIAGNPVRFQKGTLRLTPDMEWKSELGVKDNILTILLTWPMLIKYRYLG